MQNPSLSHIPSGPGHWVDVLQGIPIRTGFCKFLSTYSTAHVLFLQIGFIILPLGITG